MINLYRAIALVADYHERTRHMIAPYSGLWYLTTKPAKRIMGKHLQEA